MIAIWITAAVLFGMLLGIGLAAMLTFGPNNDPLKNGPHGDY